MSASTSVLSAVRKYAGSVDYVLKNQMINKSEATTILMIDEPTWSWAGRGQVDETAKSPIAAPLLADLSFALHYGVSPDFTRLTGPKTLSVSGLSTILAGPTPRPNQRNHASLFIRHSSCSRFCDGCASTLHHVSIEFNKAAATSATAIT